MFEITYWQMFFSITVCWILVRSFVCLRAKKCSLKRELQLLLVYICLVVVARFTFFPFSKVNGHIQPLVFDADHAFPFRINLIPLVYLTDYPVFREILLNFVGNITMFIPIGIVWPAVFRELNTHGKVLVAGVGFSLCIEILQLPFYDRVSDIDDLILNSLGFSIGYAIWLLVRWLRRKRVSA